MEENLEHNQSGNPIKDEEVKNENEIKELIESNENNQEAGALNMSEPVKTTQMMNSDNEQIPQMVIL